jgi:hypothetical protein
MKKFLVVLAAAAFVMTLPSCKKCSTCFLTTDGVKQEIGEGCGKKSEVEEFENACKATADLANALGGSTTTCTCEKS